MAVMLCYLCGEVLGSNVSRDHIPPQQIWSPEVRRRFDVSQLVTLSTHPFCNSAYSRDEEYAVRMLSLAAYESPTGRSLVQHGLAKAREGKSLGLHRAVVQSFDPRPGGLYLPDERTLVRVDGARVKRVAWKIVRGLWFLENQMVLPENTPFAIEIKEPANGAAPKFEEFWNRVRAQPSRGAYQAVFAHKYLRYEDEGEILHGWAMLLWDRVIVYCTHFDPVSPPDMSREGPRGRQPKG
jgi:hypothetical protein